jgi:SAM-dependent methyltransferase
MMDGSPTESTERFTDRVEDYARFRPGYPPAVLEVLRRETGLSPHHRVADLGSGTGLSARLFLEHGNEVLGVEPNRTMREAAERLLGGWPGFQSVAGTAEATTLASASVDLVVAAQAFHWFDPLATRAEVARILRPDGWVALLWNTRTASTAFLREYEALLVRYGTDYQRIRHDRLGDEVLKGFLGGDAVHHTVPNPQSLDLESLTGRMLSASYTPPAGHPDRAPMVRALQALFQRHQQGGRVRFEYETRLYVGRPDRESP